MIGRGLVSVIRVGVVVLLALSAAVAANIVLLGVANGPKDPVGKLSPRAGIVQLPASTVTTTPTVPARGAVSGAGDDHRTGSKQDD
jgi:hypothetical protein